MCKLRNWAIFTYLIVPMIENENAKLQQLSDIWENYNREVQNLLSKIPTSLSELPTGRSNAYQKYFTEFFSLFDLIISVIHQGNLFYRINSGDKRSGELQGFGNSALYKTFIADFSYKYRCLTWVSSGLWKIRKLFCICIKFVSFLLENVKFFATLEFVQGKDKNFYVICNLLLQIR